MADKQLKPVMVVIPQKKTTSVCRMPLVVNGVTFDLSSSHVIRLPAKRTVSSSHPTPSSHTHTHSTPSTASTSTSAGSNSTATTQTDQNATTTTTGQGTRSCSHREVERKRKLKISTAIQQLAECLPYKILGKVSHGDVLDSVIKHIKKLKQENADLTSRAQPDDDSELKSICAKLQLENILLQDLLQLLKHSSSDETENILSHDQPDVSHDLVNVSHDHRSTSHDKDTVTSVDTLSSVSSTQTHSSVHQTWPVTSLLAVTQTTTSVVSSSPASQPSSEPEATVTSSHHHTLHTSTHHTVISQPSTANIVQPWTRGDQRTLFQPHDMEASRQHHILSTRREGLDNFQTRDIPSTRDEQYMQQATTLHDSHHRNVTSYNRYRPYQLSSERRLNSNIEHNPSAPGVLRDPQYTHMSHNYSDQSHLSAEYRSRDSHVTSYDSYPNNGTVWRPYSEPHRLSGFGLSDILSHSHSESLHLEPTPPSHINNSFLVDSLLDDI